MPWLKSLLFIACLTGVIHSVQAGVLVGGTRVVYDGAKKEASLSVTNQDKDIPYLIQSWVDNIEADNNKKVPFIITPPLFRLDAGQENSLRILFTGGTLPQDRESVYWLNVKSIPSSKKTDGNQLFISIKNRIKLFYRPAGLPNTVADAYKALSFSRQGKQLQVSNPTPYHVSFSSLKVGSHDIKDALMVAPKSTLLLDLPAGASGTVSWQAINDYGGISDPATANL
ncbi:molecular chaperone [Yersinia ruckeri]|uniref:Chaperone protein fimC n=1 Tax=Yersinia ruckeri TaxID=29486 RepID=A0A085UAG5_YERRU|nr:molecular chaperone [Yersinia ruckeri]AKA37925.1 fimbrial assembly protein [Yersinia ruckeri]ARZ00228.1 fimbrial chaperone protein [Yersinia ruckeri]EEQ00197.1 fimbrial chaperone protein [Yersinia ruckeri ATCC 29473]EKN4182162.1 molecular chaperone [Yersinia ruckeri]EKN4197891.1 molecular chaperone [Yersinia ruckeri]